MTTSLPFSEARRAGAPGIAEELRHRIVRGDLEPGNQLPALSDLAHRFHTTPITARRALRLLEDEGLVRVEHGVGTFVTEWPTGFDLLQLPSFRAELEARDLDSETLVRERRGEIRHAEAAAALGVTPESPLAMLARLRRVRSTPIAFQRSFVLAELRGLVEEYAENESLYRRLSRQAGRAALMAEERLTAIALPAPEAAELGVTAGSPGWKAERLTYDGGGRPLLYDEAFFPADRVALRIQRRATASTVEYEIQA